MDPFPFCGYSIVRFKQIIKTGTHKFSDAMTKDLIIPAPKDDESPEEVLKLYKEVTNKFEKWGYFMDTITLWDLTHRNNAYTSIKIPLELKKSFGTVDKRKASYEEGSRRSLRKR